ncbi:MAG: dTDP-4-dehydrorhamnose reductase, partial [Chitinophagales bacterium]
MQKTILVTGANGQLGNEIKVLSPKFPDYHFVFVDVDVLDITLANAVDSFFDKHPVAVCINCAAYTAVDKAEEDKETAYAVNVTGVENLANACQRYNAILVHISTDFVFNGKATVPYAVNTNPDPLSIYGQTKADGESRAIMLNEKTFLIRTSWVYSAFGHNFVKTMIRLGKEKTELNVVKDQIGRPTYAADLAAFILHLISIDQLPEYGIYHFANNGMCSWAQLAEAVMHNYGLNCKVNPITTAQYPTPAKRPAYSVLNLDSAASVSGVPLMDWEISLKKCIQIIKLNEMLEKIDVHAIIRIAQAAGMEIMKIYDTDDFAVVDKSDNSP